MALSEAQWPWARRWSATDSSVGAELEVISVEPPTIPAGLDGGLGSIRFVYE
jgi:hypothetical protein